MVWMTNKENMFPICTLIWRSLLPLNDNIIINVFFYRNVVQVEMFRGEFGINTVS